MWVAAFGEAGLRAPAAPEHAGLSVASTASCIVLFDGTLHAPRPPHRNAGARAADLIASSYAQRGEAVLDDMRGSFALVVWDRTRDVLLCARDPLGNHPMFYADDGRQLLVSPSLDALTRRPGVSRAVQRTVLAELASERWMSLEETAYVAVKRLPPGHAMRVSRVGRAVFRYWDPGVAFAWMGEHDVPRFDDVLEQAIDRALGRGPAAICLSGGLDSASVAAVAADVARRHGRPAPRALSIVNSDPASDQSIVQVGVAEALGLPQTLVSFDDAAGSDGLLRSALEMSRQWPQPLVNCCLPTLERLCREGQRLGCDVLLTGDGGDEWLTAHPIVAADFLRAFDAGALHRLWRTFRNSYGLSAHESLARVTWSWGLRPLLGEVARRIARVVAPRALGRLQSWRVARGLPDWLAPDPGLRRQLIERAAERRNTLATGSLYTARMRLGLDHPLLAIGREESFELARRAAVRLAAPYWDRDVVEFLYRTPPEILNRGGVTKGMVRHTLHRRFPALGFDRQSKVVPETFFQSFMVRQASREWERLGGPRRLHDFGVVDERVVAAKLAAAIRSGSLADVYPIWMVLSVETWLRGRTDTPVPSEG